jgi:hypothetical protein
LPQRNTKDAFLHLFHTLGIPAAFVQERLQSVSHSFGFQQDATGSSAWFHFLCKHIRVVPGSAAAGCARPAVAYHDTGFRSHLGRRGLGGAVEANVREAAPLPQADYSYTRSAFFLRTSTAGEVTLCCFGATRHVRDRFSRFMKTDGWRDVLANPLVLFDLVLDGLFLDVDETVWNMNRVFGALEHVSRDTWPCRSKPWLWHLLIGLCIAAHRPVIYVATAASPARARFCRTT